MNNNTHSDANRTRDDTKRSWNNTLDDIDKKLDEAGDSASDAADDAGNWISQQREKLKGAYHDAVADNADDADEIFEHRMKATQAKAKAAGRELK